MEKITKSQLNIYMARRKKMSIQITLFTIVIGLFTLGIKGTIFIGIVMGVVMVWLNRQAEINICSTHEVIDDE